jgi:hypothetical protein
MNCSYIDGILKINNSVVLHKDKLYDELHILNNIENSYNIKINRNNLNKLILFENGSSSIFILKKISNIYSIYPIFLCSDDFEKQINTLILIIIFILKSKNKDSHIINLCNYRVFLYVPKNLSINFLDKFTNWYIHGLKYNDIFNDLLNQQMNEMELLIKLDDDFNMIDYKNNELYTKNYNRDIGCQSEEIYLPTTTVKQPTTNAFTQPVTNSFTQPVTNSFTQPTTNSFTQPTTNSFTQPTTNSFTQPTTNSFTQPTTNSFTQPTTNVFTQPTTNSFTQPTTNAFTQPTTKTNTTSNTTSNFGNSFTPNQPYNFGFNYTSSFTKNN